jgi:hypothetical protein
MHRTNIYLTARQMKQLGKQAKQTGISLGEMIRRILDEHLDKKGGRQ